MMTNHVHFVGIPRKPESISRTIQVAHVRYTRRINHQKNWTGNLWQQRYFACALDDPHLWLAIRYIEQNPIRAGIVARAEDYIWSSAAYHCGLREDPVILHDNAIMGMFDGWSETVNQVLNNEKQQMIRTRTYQGIPLGNDKFVRRISKMSGQKERRTGPGRPCKPDK
jgi:putative transposase